MLFVTVTVKLPELTLPALSTALQVTVVVPMANALPDAGTHTSETEPLLGERLLPPGTDEPPPDRLRLPSPLDPKSLFPLTILGSCDSSTIDEVRSNADDSAAATVGAVAGRRVPVTPATSARRQQSPGGRSSPWSLNFFGADPRVGYDVVTGGSEVELDTLAYSRDHDDSTLFTSENFVRRYLSSEGGGGMPGGGC